jgi:hypothetical protein
MLFCTTKEWGCRVSGLGMKYGGGRTELGIAHSSARRGLDALRIPMVVLSIARFIDKIEI